MNALVGHAAYFAQLLHEIVLGVQPAGGIDDEEVGVSALAGADRVVDHRSRVGTRLVGDDRYVGPLSPNLELVDGGCPKRICSGEGNLAPAIIIVLGQLGYGRRLARSVDPDHEYQRQQARIEKEIAETEVEKGELAQRLDKAGDDWQELQKVQGELDRVQSALDELFVEWTAISEELETAEEEYAEVDGDE